MSGDGYVRLSGLDHAFLHFETSATYMHVALTAIFDGGSLARPDGGIDIERIRAHVASRLHLLPRYRQRLHFVPVTGDPVWVDDDAFDLDVHVRHSHLPRPGTDEQLKALIARLLERLDEAQLVELTAAIAHENLRARMNHALGYGADGFSAGGFCVLAASPRPHEERRSA